MSLRNRFTGVAIFMLVLVLCGCGRFGFDAVDDPVNPDDPMIDDPPVTGPVSMTLRSGHESVQDRSIVFHDADGAVLAVESTDSSGLASHDVPAGAMVTIIPQQVSFLGGGDPIKHKIYTVMGVQPGDALSFGTELDPWATAGTVEVTIGGPVMGASSYVVDIGCRQVSTSSPNSVLQIDLNLACFDGASELDVIVYAMDNEEDPIEHAELKGVSIDPGGLTQVNMPAWSGGFNKTEISLRQIPSAADDVEIRFSVVAGEVAFYAGSSSTAFDGSSREKLHFDYPQDFADGYEYFMSLWHDSASGGDGSPKPDHVSYVLRRQTDTPGQIVHELTSFLLPTIPTSDLVLADPTRPETVFTTSGDLSGADGGLAVVTGGDSQGSEYEWWIMFPPDQVRAQVPALPEQFSQYAPNPEIQWFGGPRVVVYDADFINGWDDMRVAHGFELFNPEMRRRGADWMIQVSAGPGGFYED